VCPAPARHDVAHLERDAAVAQFGPEGVRALISSGRPGQDLPGGAAGDFQRAVVAGIQRGQRGRVRGGQGRGHLVVVVVGFRIGGERGGAGPAGGPVAHGQQGDPGCQRGQLLPQLQALGGRRGRGDPPPRDLPRVVPGQQPLADGQGQREFPGVLACAADGERDAEVVQAAGGVRRVLGRAFGAACDDDEVGGFRDKGGDGHCAGCPQAAEIRVGGTGRAGGLGDQERRMRADGGRDQHAGRRMVSGSWSSGGGR